MARAVFLDRDDTLIANAILPPEAFAGGWRGDLADPAWVRLLPGVFEACTALHEAGFELVVVTNQGVVARGGATLKEVEATNARLLALLPGSGPRGGSLIRKVYSCPFHPAGTVPEFAREHPWRKPAPGMLLAAAEELGLDPGGSWLVGDAERDLEAGMRAGLAPARCLQVGEGAGFAGLSVAAAHILANSR